MEVVGHFHSQHVSLAWKIIKLGFYQIEEWKLSGNNWHRDGNAYMVDLMSSKQNEKTKWENR